MFRPASGSRFHTGSEWSRNTSSTVGSIFDEVATDTKAVELAFVSWPDDAPLPHHARVRQVSTSRTGSLRGYSRADEGSWHWAVLINDDDRVWMLADGEMEPLDDL